MGRMRKYGQRTNTPGNTGSDFSSTAGTGTGASEIGNAESGDTGTETGTETGDGIFTDPETAAGTNTGIETETGTEVRRKRGRPKGSAGKNKAAKVSTSLEGIEGILLSLHMMGAAMLQIPELALSEKEAAQLTDAISNVAKHYDFGASEKTIAWMNLAVITGGVYGTRAFAYHVRTKAESEQKKREAKPNVISFG